MAQRTTQSGQFAHRIVEHVQFIVFRAVITAVRRKNGLENVGHFLVELILRKHTKFGIQRRQMVVQLFERNANGRQAANETIDQRIANDVVDACNQWPIGNHFPAIVFVLRMRQFEWICDCSRIRLGQAQKQLIYEAIAIEFQFGNDLRYPAQKHPRWYLGTLEQKTFFGGD